MTETQTRVNVAPEPTEGEVAYKVLKELMKSAHGHDSHLSIQLDDSFRWRVARIARDAKLPFPVVLRFMAKLARELLEEVVDINTPPKEHELNPGHGGH